MNENYGKILELCKVMIERDYAPCGLEDNIKKRLLDLTEYPKGYMTLNPGETIDSQIIVKASENAQTGEYTSREESLCVNGYLQEPELGKIFSVFYLSIVD